MKEVFFSEPTQQERTPATEAMDLLAQRSKFNRVDKINPDTLIERGGEQFIIEMVSNSKDEILSDVQVLLEKVLSPHEVDPEEVLRASVDGMTPWGTSDVAKCRVHVIKNENNELVSMVAGMRLNMLDVHGDMTNEQVYFVGYAATDMDKVARQHGLAREAYISAVMQAAKEAQSEGKVLVFAAGDAVSSSEPFWNRVGWKRVYGQTQTGVGYEELHLLLPALDFDERTGLQTEGAGETLEHLMIDSFNGNNPSKDDVIATARAFYKWSLWPREAFTSQEAYDIHASYMKEIFARFKEQAEKFGQLIFLTKEDREEMEQGGVKILSHANVDDIQTGDETL